MQNALLKHFAYSVLLSCHLQFVKIVILLCTICVENEAVFTCKLMFQEISLPWFKIQ